MTLAPNTPKTPAAPGTSQFPSSSSDQATRNHDNTSDGGSVRGEGGVVLFSNTGLTLEAGHSVLEGEMTGGPPLKNPPPGPTSNGSLTTAAATTTAATTTTLTLYEYLEDLFGEALVMLLLAQITGASSSSLQPASRRMGTDTQGTLSSSSYDAINRSLDNHLRREGFKPIRVPLPQISPQPSVKSRHRGRKVMAFTLPRSGLPVSGNPLAGGRSDSSRRQEEQKIVRGMFASSSHLKKKQKCVASTTVMDISSTWI